MVNTTLLRSKIVERNTNVAEIAALMGIDRATLYRRIADGSTFTIGEAEKISKILNLSHDEAISIFFAHNVA